ncbi:elongin C [Rhodotorula toruloides]
MADADSWVTLVSSDGHRFILPRSAALGSEMIKNTLSADFVEAQTGVIRLEEQRAEVVEKVAEYLMYKERYKETKGEIPDFKDRVKPEIALELLMASDYMEC